jgi:hypothetical protein
MGQDEIYNKVTVGSVKQPVCPASDFSELPVSSCDEIWQNTSQYYPELKELHVGKRILKEGIHFDAVQHDGITTITIRNMSFEQWQRL